MKRRFPTEDEVDFILRAEQWEWQRHGDCEFTYMAHQLAQEVRRLREKIKARRKA